MSADKGPGARGSFTIEVSHPQESRRRELTATWDPPGRVWLVGACSIEALGYRVEGWREIGVPKPDEFWDRPIGEA